MDNNRIVFYEEVIVRHDNKNYGDEMGVVLGVSEEDSVLYGYSVFLYDYRLVFSFDKGDLIATGKKYTKKEFDHYLNIHITNIEQQGLPNKGNIRYVPPKLYLEIYPLAIGPHGGFIDRFNNEWIREIDSRKGFLWRILLSIQGQIKFNKYTNNCKHIIVTQNGTLAEELNEN